MMSQCMANRFIGGIGKDKKSKSVKRTDDHSRSDLADLSSD
jgi:hypothetical protein